MNTRSLRNVYSHVKLHQVTYAKSPMLMRRSTRTHTLLLAPGQDELGVGDGRWVPDRAALVAHFLALKIEWTNIFSARVSG